MLPGAATSSCCWGPVGSPTGTRTCFPRRTPAGFSPAAHSSCSISAPATSRRCSGAATAGGASTYPTSFSPSPGSRPGKPRMAEGLQPAVGPIQAQASGSPSNATEGSISGLVLCIGVTGVTGRSALCGLLAGGVSLEQLLVVTRNPSSTVATQLLQQHINVTPGDLDQLDTLRDQLSRAKFIYIHALSGDAASADPQELSRGRALSELLASGAAPNLQLVVYNSSAGRGTKTGVSQIEQKHAVEDLFVAAGIPFLALGACMFMEEFWKRYTRPQIIGKGSFPFSLPGNSPLQLVAARDVGLAAAAAMARPSAWTHQHHLPLAGDSLTPVQMCEAFSQVQGAPVKHMCPPAWLLWFFSGDLYRITMFLRNTGYKADVAASRATFPGMLTFQQFLEETDWGNKELTYEDGMRFKSL